MWRKVPRELPIVSRVSRFKQWIGKSWIWIQNAVYLNSSAETVTFSTTLSNTTRCLSYVQGSYSITLSRPYSSSNLKKRILSPLSLIWTSFSDLYSERNVWATDSILTTRLVKNFATRIYLREISSFTYDTPISSASNRESLFHKPSRESMECLGMSSEKYREGGGGQGFA